MKEIPESAFIDLKAIAAALKTKWYYFVLCIILFLGLGLAYIIITPKSYQVQASVQLKGQSLNDKGTHNEKFIHGSELLAGNTALADEIGLLSSFKLTEQALRTLDFTVSYFSFNNQYGFFGRKMEQELYKDAFKVKIDKALPQPLGTAVYISFPDEDHYRIKVESKKAYVYNLEKDYLIQKDVSISIDTTLAIEEPFHSKMLNFSLDLHPNFIFDQQKGYYFVVNSLHSLAEDYISQLKVDPIAEESNIVYLSIKSRVPQKDVDFLNTLVDLYIAQDLNKKNQLGLKAIEFIDNQITSVYDSLSQDETKLQSFRASNQIINISTTSSDLTEQLQPLKQQQAQLQVQQRYLKNTLESLVNDETTEFIPPTSVGENDPFLSGLLTQLDQLNREKTERAYSSNNNNPLLRILEEKISNTKLTLIANIKNAIKSTEIALEENQTRINQINTQFNLLPERERSLKHIERKFQLNDKTYNYLLEKRTEAGIALASNLPDKAIVDPARQIGKGHVAPDSSLILLLCLLAGTGFPFIFIFTKSYFNDRITNKTELEEVLKYPLLGIIPQSPKQFKLPVAEQPRGAVAEAFRFIRIALSRQKESSAACSIIGVVSSQEGDGKTYCSVNLALSYARSGKRVLLIGADLRKPRLHEYFGYNVQESGLADFLENRTKLSEAIRTTIYNNLFLLPSGLTSTEVSTLIENKQLNNLFSEIQLLFDVIVVDTPPLGPVADFHIFARFFHHKILVVRQDHTYTNALKGVWNKLAPDESNDLSVVFNDVNNLVMKEYGYTGKYEYSGLH